VIRGFDSDFQVIGDSSGMQVKVNSGQCWMRGHYGRSSSQKIVTIAASNPSNPRRDAVILRVDFTDNQIELDVLTGTPAGSPTLPAVTQNTSLWETYLADVTVPAAAVTITSGNVADKRVYTTAQAKYSRSTGQSIVSSIQTDIQYTVVEQQSGDVQANSTLSQFTLLRSGLWSLSANGGFVGNSAAARSILIKDGAGTTTFSETTVPVNGSGSNTVMNTSTLERFTAGQVVKCAMHQSTGSNLSTSGTQQFCMMWIGP
jgi:hypothetical protein